jgi:nucleotide-binding universal stress UspA family protein
MYKRILLAYDGSEAGQKALLECRELAQWSQAEISLVAVMPAMMAFVGLEGGVYDVELEARQAVSDSNLARWTEIRLSLDPPETREVHA